jgi:SecD/SecF fusion protein
VAALLTILGYSMYDTIIVFDRVRENVPRMPRAAFSQIVNRSMSEVLTRSIATTSCTLMPILALLFFGGATLKDFAFALLIGVASGAYSSIFIASPVLTHWKEREPGYRARRRRIEEDLGYVPAYAPTGADIEPARKRAGRPGRLTAPDPETVSASEFEQMKRELEVEPAVPSRQTSTLTKRRAQAPPRDAAPKSKPKPAPPPAPTERKESGPHKESGPQPAPRSDAGGDGDGDGHGDAAPERAPDIAENEGVAPVQRPKRRAKPRNRRHGRRR